MTSYCIFNQKTEELLFESPFMTIATMWQMTHTAIGGTVLRIMETKTNDTGAIDSEPTTTEILDNDMDYQEWSRETDEKQANEALELEKENQDYLLPNKRGIN